MRTQTVVAGAPMSSPTKQFLECPSFSEAQAVGEVTAVVTDIDNAQPREPNEPKDAAQMSTITEVDVDSMTSSVSDESAAPGVIFQSMYYHLPKATKAARKILILTSGQY